MDAAADYAAATRFLTNNLPAYVSYTIRSHVVGGFMHADETKTIVVRTSDGTVVKGERPHINIDADSHHGKKAAHDAPFDPACYAATGAAPAIFDGNAVEALTLKNTCDRGNNDGDFSKLYVDRLSREPLAVIGGNRDDNVDVHLEQRFARTGKYVMPAKLDVSVKGSGWMGWLNVDAHQEFANYVFSDKMP